MSAGSAGGPAETAGGEHVRVARTRGTGRITLDRPDRLNALTLGMVRSIAATLVAWEQDPDVQVVLIDGAGPRGFCAGGDIRTLYDSARTSDSHARVFWAEEYRLNAKIAGYPKPVVALMPGVVMGGGVGLSAHARHRVVTETTRLAMPEVGIGLIPDVGGTWLLSRAPGETGTYLALTGVQVGAADAILAGLADWCVPQADLDALAAALVREAPRGGEAVDAVIGRHVAAPGEAPLTEHRAGIDRAFAHDAVEAILDALRRDGSGFARQALGQIEAKSPTSLKLTLRALREARGLATLQDCLRLEYRLMCRILPGHDFREGVRAAVIDKDRAPKWRPAGLGEVSPKVLDAHFAPLGPDELRV